MIVGDDSLVRVRTSSVDAL